MQVDPVVAAAVEPDRQVLQARSVDVLYDVRHAWFGVFETRPRAVRARHSAHRCGDNRRASPCAGRRRRGSGHPSGRPRRCRRDWSSARGSRAHTWLAGEVVEHQDAAAQPVGAHLEPGAVGRERVRPDRPRVARSPSAFGLDRRPAWGPRRRGRRSRTTTSNIHSARAIWASTCAMLRKRGRRPAPSSSGVRLP